MKNSITPINIAVDSAAIFVSFLSWTFGFWTPIFLAYVLFCIVRPLFAVSILLFTLFTALFLPFGMLLKWLANGIVQRKRARTVFSVLVLVFLSCTQGFVPLFARSQKNQSPFEHLLIGIAMLFVAVITSMGLTKGARELNE